MLPALGGEAHSKRSGRSTRHEESAWTDQVRTSLIGCEARRRVFICHDSRNFFLNHHYLLFFLLSHQTTAISLQNGI